LDPVSGGRQTLRLLRRQYGASGRDQRTQEIAKADIQNGCAGRRTPSLRTAAMADDQT